MAKPPRFRRLASDEVNVFVNASRYSVLAAIGDRASHVYDELIECVGTVPERVDDFRYEPELAALDYWAVKWNVATWVRNWAAPTARFWLAHPQGRYWFPRFSSSARWEPRYESYTAVAPDPGWRPWDPGYELHAQPLDEGLDTFLERAERHYEARYNLLQNNGFKPIARRPEQTTLHAEWFVDFKFRGLTIAEIADGSTGRQRGGSSEGRVVDDRTIKSGIKAISDLIGMAPARGSITEIQRKH